ncbi:hypothetical protein Y032_0566g21 [Ancylostoma ceylanicum]|nr:hypothetical protein Y032_0566g21 [Ancylostoma ceylanicum]
MAFDAGVGPQQEQAGVSSFPKRRSRDPRVVHWWRTLKGLPFLPRDHFHLMRALTVVPVEPIHLAYQPCLNFLDYFNRTWLSGLFESMWFKYLVKGLRTTNFVENSHGYVYIVNPIQEKYPLICFGRLRGLFSGKKHPKFNERITMLQEITGATASRLNRMIEFPEELRPLRPRDIRRREYTEAAMATFVRIQGGRYVNTAVVGRYCRKMSRYTSDKAIWIHYYFRNTYRELYKVTCSEYRIHFVPQTQYHYHFLAEIDVSSYPHELFQIDVSSYPHELFLIISFP